MIRPIASLVATVGLTLTTATVALAQAAPNDRVLILAELDLTLAAPRGRCVLQSTDGPRTLGASRSIKGSLLNARAVVTSRAH